MLWEQEVVGSNPATPTDEKPPNLRDLAVFSCPDYPVISLWQFRGSFVAVNSDSLRQKLGLEEGKKGKYPYTEARLSDAGDDLSKQWVVVYYVFDVNKDRLVRKRINITGNSIEERKRKAAQYIKGINKLLESGFHVNEKKAPAKELPLPEPVVAAPSANKPLTFIQAVEFYKKVKTKDLREDTTMELYDLYLRQFTAFLESTGNRKILLKHLTPRIVHDFFDSATVGPRYYNNMLGFFKSFATFYINREDISANPFRNLKNLRVDESDDHRPFSAELTREIRDAILAKGDEQLWLFCQFIYFLFMRPGKELRLLQVRDILEKQVKVASDTAKNRKIGYVDISVALEKVIEHYNLRSYRPTHYVFSIDGHPGPEPVGVNYFYKRHVKIMKDLGLFGHDYDLYSWKPTGAVALYRATKDILRVQKHCRHGSPDQTYTYLRKYGLVFEGVDMTDVPAIWI